MIRHIPNKYTQKMLLMTIDENFKGKDLAFLSRS